MFNVSICQNYSKAQKTMDLLYIKTKRNTGNTGWIWWTHAYQFLCPFKLWIFRLVWSWKNITTKSILLGFLKGMYVFTISHQVHIQLLTQIMNCKHFQYDLLSFLVWLSKREDVFFRRRVSINWIARPKKVQLTDRLWQRQTRFLSSLKKSFDF